MLVKRSETKPFLFMFVAVISVFLTQLGYYATNIWQDGGDSEPATSLLEFFVKERALPVACSMVAIAASTVFARWCSTLSFPKCPFSTQGGTTTESSSGVEAGVHGAAHNEHLMEMAPVSLTHQHHPVQPVDLLGLAVSIKHGRPDMTALIASG